MSDILDFLQNRNSSPRLEEPAPSPEDLQAIFKAAMRTPDHAWLHPWRFITISGSRREAFGQVLLLPCDLPDLPLAALVRLRATPAPAVAWDGERVHPLLAHLDARSLPRARALLEEEGPVGALSDGAARVKLPGPWLRNLNRPPPR